MRGEHYEARCRNLTHVWYVSVSLINILNEVKLTLSETWKGMYSVRSKTWFDSVRYLFARNNAVAPVKRRVQKRSTSLPNVMMKSYIKKTGVQNCHSGAVGSSTTMQQERTDPRKTTIIRSDAVALNVNPLAHKVVKTLNMKALTTVHLQQ